MRLALLEAGDSVTRSDQLTRGSTLPNDQCSVPKTSGWFILFNQNVAQLRRKQDPSNTVIVLHIDTITATDGRGRHDERSASGAGAGIRGAALFMGVAQGRTAGGQGKQEHPRNRPGLSLPQMPLENER